jgi:hypothetical protein
MQRRGWDFRETIGNSWDRKGGETEKETHRNSRVDREMNLTMA